MSSRIEMIAPPVGANAPAYMLFTNVPPTCGSCGISHQVQRPESPQELEKGMESHIRGALLLEKEANQFHGEGRLLGARLRRSKASTMRRMADSLQQKAVLLAQQRRDAVGSGSEVCDDARRDPNVRKYVKCLKEEANQRTTPLSMGGLDRWRWLEMQSDPALGAEIAETLPVTALPAAHGYFWNGSNQSGQCESRINHLKGIIDLGGRDLDWINAAKDHPNLLSYRMLGYDITATTDVLVAERSAVEAGMPNQGMRLLMDIRENIADSDVDQAQARLLLSNFHSPNTRPVVVLTDLNDEWHAMWMDGSIIYQHTFASRGRAVGFARDLVAGRFDTCKDISRTSFAKRRQMDDLIRVNCSRGTEFVKKVEALRMQIYPKRPAASDAWPQFKSRFSRNSLEHPPAAPIDKLAMADLAEWQSRQREAEGAGSHHVTRKMLLQKIEWLRKGAFEMMEEAKVMAEEAAKASFQYPDTKMLVEARELQDDADKQLSEALCMEKLLHGDVPLLKETRPHIHQALRVLQMLRQSRDYVTIENFDTCTWPEALATAGLRAVSGLNGDMPAMPELPEPEFAWDERESYAQFDRYSPHIKRLIDLGREDVEWVDAAQDPELLSYSGVRKFGYNCNGTTDLLAAKRSAVKAHHPEKGAQILFDVSLKLAESDLRHAQVRVLLANLHAPAEKPVVVSTDLRSNWHVTWIDDEDILQFKFPSRAHAVEVINNTLAKCITASQGPIKAKIAERRWIRSELVAEHLPGGFAMA